MKKHFRAILWLSLSIVLISIRVDNLKSQHVSEGTEFNSHSRSIEHVNGYRVVKGERPKINIEKVACEAFEDKKLLIKLYPESYKTFSSNKSTSTTNGYVKTGIAEMDKLNSKFGVFRYISFIEELYRQSPSVEPYSKRHNAWGFHLWFELSFDKEVDVRTVVKEFLNIEGVEIAEPVYKKRLIKPVETAPIKSGAPNKLNPNDPLYVNNQWHFNNTGQTIGGVQGIVGVDIKAENAWDIEMGNSSVIVAIMDSGIDFNHEDLSENIWPGIGPDGTNTIPDFHGTHVAGTVAAVTNNEIGLAGIAGGSGNADGVKLMSIDIFNGSTYTGAYGTYNGFVYAADNGAAISQNSWGYTNPNVYNTPDLEGIDYFNENGGGHALVGGGISIFAAGNDNSSERWYPAYYSGAMAVASHTNRGTKSGFSNYGEWIDIIAPGTNIASTSPDNNYSWSSGTSMACPHVSGVAALVISNAYGILTPDELWDILVNNVDDIYEYNSTFTGLLGSGSLNAYKALTAVQVFPKISLDYITDIKNNSATVFGTVVSEGGTPVIERGFVWSKSTNPTIDENDGIISVGNGIGEFNADIFGLESNEDYYIRSFATNSFATAYGFEMSFSTTSSLTLLVVDENKDPIHEAIIHVNNTIGITDELGEANFYKQTGIYDFLVEAPGFFASGGTVNIGAGSNILKLILNSEQSDLPVILGQEQVCLGSQVIYSITSDMNGAWEVQGGQIISSNSNYAFVFWTADNDNNVVRYRTIDADNYQTAYSFNVSINENHLLTNNHKPQIHIKGDLPILICSKPNQTYSWFLDGILIEDKTEQFLVAEGISGSFRVQIIDQNNCPHTSNPVSVSLTSAKVARLELYPNPSFGDFNLSLKDPIVGHGVITVTNSHGKIVYQNTIYKTEEYLKEFISLGSLPQGIYLVSIRFGNTKHFNARLSVQ